MVARLLSDLEAKQKELHQLRVEDEKEDALFLEIKNEAKEMRTIVQTRDSQLNKLNVDLQSSQEQLNEMRRKRQAEQNRLQEQYNRIKNSFTTTTTTTTTTIVNGTISSSSSSNVVESNVQSAEEGEGDIVGKIMQEAQQVVLKKQKEISELRTRLERKEVLIQKIQNEVRVHKTTIQQNATHTQSLLEALNQKERQIQELKAQDEIEDEILRQLQSETQRLAQMLADKERLLGKLTIMLDRKDDRITELMASSNNTDVKNSTSTVITETTTITNTLLTNQQEVSSTSESVQNISQQLTSLAQQRQRVHNNAPLVDIDVQVMQTQQAQRQPMVKVAEPHPFGSQAGGSGDAKLAQQVQKLQKENDVLAKSKRSAEEKVAAFERTSVDDKRRIRQLEQQVEQLNKDLTEAKTDQNGRYGTIDNQNGDDTLFVKVAEPRKKSSGCVIC